MAEAAAFLGAVALVLAALGLYGVTSYLVAVRSREIAIRIALGAMPRRVARMVMRKGLGTVMIGTSVSS